MSPEFKFVLQMSRQQACYTATQLTIPRRRAQAKASRDVVRQRPMEKHWRGPGITQWQPADSEAPFAVLLLCVTVTASGRAQRVPTPLVLLAAGPLPGRSPSQIRVHALAAPSRNYKTLAETERPYPESASADAT